MKNEKLRGYSTSILHIDDSMFIPNLKINSRLEIKTLNHPPYREKKERIIDYLRRLFPEVEWWYNGHSWSSNSELHATRVSALAPRYDGDDDNFVSEFYVYGTKPYPTRLHV